jgi:hypothetical protein
MHAPLKTSNEMALRPLAPEPWGINPFTRKARNHPTEASKRKGLGLNPLTLKPRLEIRPAELEESFVHLRRTQSLDVLLASLPASALKATARTPRPIGMVPLQRVSSAPLPPQHNKALPVKHAGAAFDTSELLLGSTTWNIADITGIPSQASLVSTPRPRQWDTGSIVKFAGTAFDTSKSP